MRDRDAGPAHVLLVDSYGGQVIGGSSVVVRDLVEGLDRERFSPVVACMLDGPWPEQLRSAGVPTHVVARTRLRSARNLATAVAALARIIRLNGIDVVHASENSSFLYATVAARLTRRPVVWHVHSPLRPSNRREKAARALLGRLRPDHIVFTSDGARDRTPSFEGVPTSVVYPGVDQAQCQSGSAERARAALGIPPGVPVVSMFARFGVMKGQEDFVRCVGELSATHPDLHGVICGIRKDGGAYWRHVQELAEQYELGERLHTPGHVAPAMAFDVMAASDVVLHPTRAESFGLAVLEAMAAGRVVVSTDTDGPCLLIDDGVTGILVPVADVDAMVAAVGGLLADADRRGGLGSRAATAAAEFSRERMVAGVAGIWAEVLARSPEATVGARV